MNTKNGNDNNNQRPECELEWVKKMITVPCIVFFVVHKCSSLLLMKIGTLTFAAVRVNYLFEFMWIYQYDLAINQSKSID